MRNPANDDHPPTAYLERFLLPWGVLIFTLVFWIAVILSIQNMLGLVESGTAMTAAIDVAGI